MIIKVTAAVTVTVIKGCSAAGGWPIYWSLNGYIRLMCGILIIIMELICIDCGYTHLIMYRILSFTNNVIN